MKGKKFFSLFVLLGTLALLCTAWCKREELREWGHRAPVAQEAESPSNRGDIADIKRGVEEIKQTLNDEKEISYQTSLSSSGVITTKKVKPTSQPVVAAKEKEATPVPAPTASTQPATEEVKTTPLLVKEGVLPWYKHPVVLIPAAIIIGAFLFRSAWRSRVGTKEEKETKTTTPAVGTKRETVTTRSSTDWGKVVWRLAILGVLVFAFYTKWGDFMTWCRSHPTEGVVELQKDWDIHADSDDYTSIQCGWYNRKFSINSSLPIEIIDPDGNSHTYYPKKGKFKAGSQIRSHGKWSFRSLVPGRVASITFHCPVEN